MNNRCEPIITEIAFYCIGFLFVFKACSVLDAWTRQKAHSLSLRSCRNAEDRQKDQ